MLPTVRAVPAAVKTSSDEVIDKSDQALTFPGCPPDRSGMPLIRCGGRGGPARPALLDGRRVRPVPGIATMAELLALPAAEIQGLCAEAPRQISDEFDPASLLAPVDGRTEVWAAGVTYERSMHAR